MLITGSSECSSSGLVTSVFRQKHGGAEQE
jgi:hypothetical protein